MTTVTTLVTMHIQKDKRITLGTCCHLYRDCPSLKSRTNVVEIQGEILQMIPKCNYCFERYNKATVLNYGT